MNHSPYSPPKAVLAAQSSPPPTLLWATYMAGFLVTLPSVVVLVFVVATLLNLTPAEPQAALKAAPPSSIAAHTFIALSGILLIGRHRLAPLMLFACVVLASTYLFIHWQGKIVGLIWPAFYGLAFLLAAQLRVRGFLSRRPNNSFKPKPLRGSA